MSTATSKKSMSWWINIVITIALMMFVGKLPPFGAMTPLGMEVFAVFLGMLYGWIACDLIWPSILGLLFLGLSDYSTVNGVFGTIFSADVMQTLMCFLIAGLLNCFGVTDFLAGKIMAFKFIIGHPWKMIAMLFAGTALISMLASSVAAIFIMWSIFAKVAEGVGCDKKENIYTFTIAGVVFASVIASMILPFKATTVAYMGFAKSAIQFTVPTVPYILFMLLFSVLMLGIYLLLGRFVFRCDVSKFENDTDHFAYMRGKKATKNEKIGLAFITAFIVPLIWPGIFPAEWAITQFFSSLGLIGVIVILITIGSFLRDEDGKQIAPISKLMGSVGWDMIFLLAATFPMAAAMRSADCGIMATINGFVRPMVATMGPTALLFITVFLLGAVTQITHNGVLAAMFMPFLIPLYAETGGNPVVYWFCLYIILQSAYATPAASMYSGIIFGHESMKGSNIAYLYGITAFLISYLLLVVTSPIQNMIF